MRWSVNPRYAYFSGAGRQEREREEHIAAGEMTPPYLQLPRYLPGLFRPTRIYRRQEVGDVWNHEKEAELDLVLCDASEFLETP
jgi:hypothetical protein